MTGPRGSSASHNQDVTPLLRWRKETGGVPRHNVNHCTRARLQGNIRLERVFEARIYIRKTQCSNLYCPEITRIRNVEKPQLVKDIPMATLFWVSVQVMSGPCSFRIIFFFKWVRISARVILTVID